MRQKNKWSRTDKTPTIGNVDYIFFQLHICRKLFLFIYAYEVKRHVEAF